MSPSSKSESQKDSVLLGSDLKNECRERKSKSRVWVDDSGVKNIDCACRGPGFHSQYPPTWSLTTSCYSSSRGLDSLFWPPKTTGTHVVYIHMCKYSQNKNLFKNPQNRVSPAPYVYPCWHCRFSVMSNRLDSSLEKR